MEALERRGKLWAIAAIFFIVFTSQYKGAWGHRNSTKMSYVCPPNFIRLGHSCYYFSDKKTTWQNALFACKLLVALSFYATGSYQRLVGGTQGTMMSQQSVSRALSEVTDALNSESLLDKWLRFPHTRQQRNQIKTRFYEKFKIPSVIGCIDGTHVAIIRPSLNEERFYNRKGYHSRNVLIDIDSNLSVPARWEDRNLRIYLNKAKLEKASRWIGGIYDYNARAWKWGGELRSMHYQSFSKMKKMTPDQLQWHCIAMSPELKYRWTPDSCYQPRQYICQTKLRKVSKSKVKDLRRRWQRLGKLNEITAPSVSREVNDPMVNDVTVNPMLNPKSYDLRPSPLRLHPHSTRNTKAHNVRPNELRKRSRPTHRRLTKPFPGYQWNRRDPEASFNYNANLLKSGKTGLTPQQVKSHLARLKHLRDKQLERQKRLRERGDWLVNDEPPRMTKTHARTYTIDNNISALHPKTIVEEFDMLPPPPPPVPIARLTRGAFRGYH